MATTLAFVVGLGCGGADSPGEIQAVTERDAAQAEANAEELSDGAAAGEADEAQDGTGISEEVQAVLEPYLAIQTALADDSTDGVADAVERLGAGLADAGELPSEDLAGAAEAVGEAEDLDAAREAFKALSNPLVDWALEQGVEDLTVVDCPMAPGRWVQKGTEVANPYHGSEMLRCGNIIGGEGADG